jgi:hypothetical protein
VLIEIQHKITQDEIVELIAELSKIKTSNFTLMYFLDSCIADLKGYVKKE